MKKLVLLSLLLGAVPITMMAQDDDLYFVPTKENVAKEAEKYGMPAKTYYAGSNRSTDEYNRRAWSRVAPIDSAGNDIIDFTAERGVYPDSAYSEETDYEYTRRMSRFDDYSPSEAYWEGYRDGRWMSPWYYGSYYGWHDLWYYDSWYYDPWYYGGYYGYYSPYYYGWYSPWYGSRYPYYWYGYHSWYPHYGISVGRRFTGTRNHSAGVGSGYNNRRNNIGNSRNNRNSTGNTVNRTNSNATYSFGGVRNSNTSTNQNTGSSSSRSTSYGGSRSSGGGRFGGGRR